MPRYLDRSTVVDAPVRSINAVTIDATQRQRRHQAHVAHHGEHAQHGPSPASGQHGHSLYAGLSKAENLPKNGFLANSQLLTRVDGF